MNTLPIMSATSIICRFILARSGHKACILKTLSDLVGGWAHYLTAPHIAFPVVLGAKGAIMSPTDCSTPFFITH